MSEQFAVNGLSLNSDNKSVIKFYLNHLQDYSFQIIYQEE